MPFDWGGNDALCVFGLTTLTHSCGCIVGSVERARLRIGQPDLVFGPGRRLQEGNGTQVLSNMTNMTAEAAPNVTTEAPRDGVCRREMAHRS